MLSRCRLSCSSPIERIPAMKIWQWSIHEHSDDYANHNVTNIVLWITMLQFHKFYYSLLLFLSNPHLNPSGQIIHSRAPVVLLYVPFGHTCGASIPRLGHRKPASQSLQSLCPSMSEYVPLAHSKYADNPSVGQWAPLGQEWHWMFPAEANVPAKHFVGKLSLSLQLKLLGIARIGEKRQNTKWTSSNMSTTDVRCLNGGITKVFPVHNRYEVLELGGYKIPYLFRCKKVHCFLSVHAVPY